MDTELRYLTTAWIQATSCSTTIQLVIRRPASAIRFSSILKSVLKNVCLREGLARPVSCNGIAD